MDSLWPQIERILPTVSKPARYIGGEQGSVSPVHDPGRVARGQRMWQGIQPERRRIISGPEKIQVVSIGTGGGSIDFTGDGEGIYIDAGGNANIVIRNLSLDGGGTGSDAIFASA